MKINILTQFHGLSIIRFVKNGEVRNMLFDEIDLIALENEDARDYFKEVLQSYYGQNYRAALVTLYSFVIYDLFIKLQTMANEGDKKAEAKVKEINKNEEINDIDGVKIDFPDKWVHLRKSNTEPIIRVYSEAATPEAAEEIGRQIMKVIEDLAK